MIEKKIFFKTLDDVKKFVSKSVMGILSLDLTSPITMIANTATDDSLLKEIETFSEAVVVIK